MKTLLLLLLLFLQISLQAQNRSVHWISNAGFYIDTSEGDILIDAILNANDEIARAEGRFADVRLIFISHVHGDHFNARGLITHLKANTKARAILTPEIFAALKAAGLEKSMEARVTVSFPEPEALEPFRLGAYSGHILQYKHSGVQNIGFGLKGPDINLVYLNGGQISAERAKCFSNLYPENDLLIANKWPLVRAAYIDGIKENFAPSLLLMAHHSGRQDGLITQQGGASKMEQLISRKGMQGKIFGRRMESVTF